MIFSSVFISGALSNLSFLLTSISADVRGDEFEEQRVKALLAVIAVQTVEVIFESNAETAAAAAKSIGITMVRF